MLYKGRWDAISLSIQQLACLNIILAGQFWTSKPPFKTNMQIIKLTFVLSSLFVLLIHAAPIWVSVGTRKSNASFHLGD